MTCASSTKRARLAAVVLLALTCIFGCRATEADRELLVFAAASTADAMADVGREFEAESSSKVTFSFGASRDLARQIRAGAQAAIFISADAESVDSLVAANAVQPEDRRTFASNRLVVVVPQGSGLTIGAAADLAKVAHLAIGDPMLVPAGTYAKQWLEKEGVWTDVAARVVPALDVRAALATVEAGSAEAGIVYRTDAARSKRVQVAYEVPAERTRTISYVAARVASAQGDTARRFLDFVTGPKARAILAKHGFVL